MVGAGAGVGMGAAAGASAAALMAPVSRFTIFGGALFPEKNSEAVSAGSSESAGGKMSAWNESA